MAYESRRVTISYFAAEEVCRVFGLPLDIPSQALGAALEKLIFTRGNVTSVQPPPAITEAPVIPNQPNKAALASMLNGYRQGEVA
ncbi:hypothetical protein NIES2109_64140 (plasmid) [Nostoc sp. HK-01]|nr:hypothetical protein NIES2109_64140 [Nostoc sp. HK-01]